MGELKKFYKKTLPDIALYFVTQTVKNLLEKDTVRSALRGQIRKLLTGSREKPHQIVPTAEYYADRIIEVLGDKGIFPESICIDGLPGSGKSSLGRALEQKCGLKWRTLYWQELKEAYPFKKGRIYENIRLIRTQDMEDFDIIIYIDCTTEEAKGRVITRDRNATLVDVVNFSRLKKIGDAAFEMLGGEEIKIKGSFIRMKQRPQEGYGDIERLKARLQEKGLDAEGYLKEELLFIYCYGKPEKGISPYIKFGAYNTEILSGIYNALIRALAKRFLT